MPGKFDEKELLMRAMAGSAGANPVMPSAVNPIDTSGVGGRAVILPQEELGRPAVSAEDLNMFFNDSMPAESSDIEDAIRRQKEMIELRRDERDMHKDNRRFHQRLLGN